MTHAESTLRALIAECHPEPAKTVKDLAYSDGVSRNLCCVIH